MRAQHRLMYCHFRNHHFGKAYSNLLLHLIYVTYKYIFKSFRSPSFQWGRFWTDSSKELWVGRSCHLRENNRICNRISAAKNGVITFYSSPKHLFVLHFVAHAIADIKAAAYKSNAESLAARSNIRWMLTGMHFLCCTERRWATCCFQPFCLEQVTPRWSTVQIWSKTLSVNAHRKLRSNLSEWKPGNVSKWANRSIICDGYNEDLDTLSSIT